MSNRFFIAKVRLFFEHVLYTLASRTYTPACPHSLSL